MNKHDIDSANEVEKLEIYAEHFQERYEDFADELDRVPKAYRKKVRFNRDAHQAAAIALRQLVSVKKSLKARGDHDGQTRQAP